MKELIKAYQSGKSNEVVEKVLGMVDTVENMKYKGVATTDNGLKFVANRIRALILKSVFREREMDVKSIPQEEKEEMYEALSEYRSVLADANWIDLDFKAVYNYDFTSMYAKRKEIVRYLGEVESIGLYETVDKFTRMQSLEGNGEFRGSYTERKSQWLPFFKEALEYALLKVDVTRSDKEIIKYINKTMMTKFIEIQMREESIKRIRQGNKSVYIKPKIKENQDAWMLMFGKTLTYVGVDSFDLYLTKKQKQFVLKLHEIIKTDLKQNNVDAFKWTTSLKPILNKRYLAGRMGMEEANFKQTLKRCEKKIFDNWKQVTDTIWNTD